jgi:hypothetical protein
MHSIVYNIIKKHFDEQANNNNIFILYKNLNLK